MFPFKKHGSHQPLNFFNQGDPRGLDTGYEGRGANSTLDVVEAFNPPPFDIRREIDIVVVVGICYHSSITRSAE